MSIEREGVEKEREEKHRQLRAQYAGEMRSFWDKQIEEYVNFFKKCPSTARGAGLFFAGLFIGMIL